MTTYTTPYRLPRPEPLDKIAAAQESLRISIGDLADAANRELGQMAIRTEAAVAASAATSQAVQLTTPVDGYYNVGVQGNHRLPFRLPVAASRVRVHFANRNDANDTGYTVPDLRINQFCYIGEHKYENGAPTGQFVDTPVNASGVGTLPLPDAQEYAGEWMDVDLEPNVEYLFSYSYYNPSGAQMAQGMGASWLSGATGNVDKLDVSLTKRGVAPLAVWLEVEVPANVPVLGWVGDSLLVGREATMWLHDSPAWVHGMASRVMPRLYASAGSRITDWTGAPSSPRWTRWAGLGKCDAAIIQLGSNDIFDYDNRASEVQDVMAQRLADLVPLVRQHVSDRIYYATIMPRNTKTWSPEFVNAWRAWNDYLGTLPHGAVGCIDFASAVAARGDDARIAEHLVAGDGTHLLTGGYSAMASAVPGQIATR